MTDNLPVDEQYTRCPYCLTVFRVRGPKTGAGEGEVRCVTCRESFDVVQNFVVQDELGRYKPLGKADQGRAESKSGVEHVVTGGRTAFDRDGATPDPSESRTDRADSDAAESSGREGAPGEGDPESESAVQEAGGGIPDESAARWTSGMDHNGATEAGPGWENTGSGIEDEDGSGGHGDASAEIDRPMQEEADAEDGRLPVEDVAENGGAPDIPARRDTAIGHDRDSASFFSGTDAEDQWGKADQDQGYREPGHGLSMGDDDAVRDNEAPESGDEADADGRGPADPARHPPDATDTGPDADILAAGPDETGAGDESGPAFFARREPEYDDNEDAAPTLPEVEAEIPESEEEGNDLVELVRPSPPSDGEPLADLEVTPEPVAGNWFNVDTEGTMERNPFEAVEPPVSSDRNPPVQTNISMNGVDAYIADRPNPLAGFVWFLVAVGFLFLLGLQVRTFFVDRYAQDERFRPYLSLFCRVAACELPSRRDTFSFSITNTRVELHPDVPGSLKITVKLVNQAEFSQPYPDLQLTLIDRVGRVIGRRTFSPDTYLEADVQNLLESGELVSVDFNLAHPHEKAVGFVVEIVLESAV